MKFDTSNLIEIFAIIISLFSDAAFKDQKDFERYALCAVNAITILYLFVEMIWKDCILGILYLLDVFFWMPIILLFVFALLPPLIARLERESIEYQKGNLLYNVLGAIAGAMVVALAQFITVKQEYLAYFPIKGIMSMLFPLCVDYALFYQRIERENADSLDHNPSYDMLNQRFNIIHLVNVYFWSTLSAVFVVAYTIYCKQHGMRLEFRWHYFVMFLLISLFFIGLSLHEHKYLYFQFLIVFPAIIALCAYWMSWFDDTGTEVRGMQILLLIILMLIYAGIVMYKQGVLRIEKKESNKDKLKKFKLSILIQYDAKKIHTSTINIKEMPEKKKMRIKRIKIENWFSIIPLILIFCGFFVMWIVPGQVKRLSEPETERYVRAIFSDTVVNPEQVLQELKTIQDDRVIFDGNDYDEAMLLTFLYDTYRPILIRKGIIDADARYLGYDSLEEWYRRTP